jgi:hypothetical protein
LIIPVNKKIKYISEPFKIRLKADLLHITIRQIIFSKRIPEMIKKKILFREQKNENPMPII